MKIRIFQKGFNYSQDGRGNRLILHLQGCNMKCPWCSNPEGMPLEGVLMKGKMSFQEYEVDEVVRECVGARPMFFDGGGVTLTGGEISMQFDAVLELLKKLGKENIHRTIESNGSHPDMEKLIPHVDQWIMDIKHYDEEKHIKWIGVSNQWTLKNMELVTEKHPDVLLRVPLIPGFNDSGEDAEGFAKLFREKIHNKSTTMVEFLEYHEFGKEKWLQCGKEYTMKPDKLQPGTREYFEEVLTGQGVRCVRT